MEAFQRFGDPRPVAGMTVILVAAVGIVINVATALLFSSGRKGDINVKGALIVAVILGNTWGLLRDSIMMSLSAVPPGIELSEVEAHLSQLANVERVHDLHIWPISTTETVLTAHLVPPGDDANDEFLRDAAESLKHRFGIGHTTIELERQASLCELESSDTPL